MWVWIGSGSVCVHMSVWRWWCLSVCGGGSVCHCGDGGGGVSVCVCGGSLGGGGVCQYVCVVDVYVSVVVSLSVCA